MSKGWLGRGASRCDARGDVRCVRLGDKIEVGDHVAVKPDLPSGEDEPLADKRKRASQEVEAAFHLGIAHRAGHMQI